MARHRWPHAQNGCRHGMKQRGAASMASCPDRSNQGSEPGDCGKCLRIFSTLDCTSFSLSLLASFCTLPSYLLGPNPFLCHPALLGLNHCLLPTTHFADRTSHLSSLFPRGCSFVRPHCAVTSNFASTIHPPSNPLHPVPQHPWPGGMREAIK